MGTSTTPATVTAIVVNYNSGSLLIQAVNSLRQQAYAVDVVVVDNCSSDGSAETISHHYPDVTVVHSTVNLGFAAGANLGARNCATSFLLFLNPDTVLAPGCVAALIAAYERRPGIVGPVLTVAANQGRDFGATINHLGMSLSLDGTTLPLYVSGCALFTSTVVFHELGGFDGRYFLFVEDVELCWRALLAGYDVSVAEDAEAAHQGGATAPGGYFRSGTRYVTSPLRVRLRERNSIALMLSCAPWWWLPSVVPTLVARSALLAAGGLLLGHPKLAAELAQGVVWNIAELPRSFCRRRSLPRTKSGDKEARRRVVRDPVFLRMLRHSGVPHLASDDAKR